MIQMKQQVRALGIDDSPFKFGGGKALVVGALVRVPDYIEAVMKTEVTIDGLDSTKKLREMVSGSRYRDQIKVIIIDGIALAGFNIVDMDALNSALGIPVLAITRDEPDLEKMRSALSKHFNDSAERFALVTKHPLRRISTGHNPLYASGVGLEWREFEELVKLSTVKGVVPEPVRIAHLIGTAMAAGESYGRP